MRISLTTALVFLALLPVFSQARIEAKIGGSNFLGATINSAYDIAILEDGNQSISPSFGIGILFPGWEDPTSIIHFGLNYRLFKWGFGIETSTFFANPLWGDGGGNGFVDLIIYPNVNYTIPINSNWYINISGGAYFAFSRSSNFQIEQTNLVFEGDVIPGGGLTVGYKL